MDWHIPIITLCFIACDVITGFIQALKNKCVDSSVMRDGLFHKVGFICAIALGFLCEYAVAWLDIGFSAPIVVPVCIFICVTEIVSILENIKKLTPDLGAAKFLEIFGVDPNGEKK